MTEEQQWEFWLTSAAQELEHIADITAKMAMVGSANPTNPSVPSG